MGGPAGCADGAVQCFVYDPQWRGVVGLAPSFGSDQFNDHHFHYGYFLYAAGVLAAHDPSVVTTLRPVMDLLAADIAGGSDTGVTPRLRVYDVYAGHSWAAGASQFADGNNQESSSEAVTAWAGLSLWAHATHDTDLARESAWLLSSEAAAARAYWTEPQVPAGFESPDVRHQLGRQARLRHVVLPRAIGDPRHPVDPDEPVVVIPTRRPRPYPGQRRRGHRIHRVHRAAR